MDTPRAPLTEEEQAYLGWDLRLKPHEYWEMDAEEWEASNAVQVAYRHGAESAVEEHRKSEERERRNAESLAQLKEMAGH